ncbi:MAG: hypothetical protein AAF519_17660 [Bacteroidota bacterium]
MISKAAIILARLNSQRFPNKALHKIGHLSLLEWCIYHLKKSDKYKIILATSDQLSDDRLLDLAQKMEIQTFRGDLDDVYRRVSDCLEHHKITSFARVNGDSPFPSSELIDRAFHLLKSENLDFVTNLAPRSYPYGVAVEVFDAQTFKVNYQNLKSDAHREHITSYFYENLDWFKYKNILSGYENLQDLRLVVDHPSDVRNIQKVIKSIDTNKPINFMEIAQVLKEDND